MRCVGKAGVILLVLLCFISCSANSPLASLDEDGALESGLVYTLEHILWGQFGLEVDEQPGLVYLGEVHGRCEVESDAQVAAFSFIGERIHETERVSVATDGSWGPLTVVHGPKLLVLFDGSEVAGQYLAPTLFAVAPLDSEPTADLLQADAGATGLTALALFHAGSVQAAADVLARLQDFHRSMGGIPCNVNCFGQSDGEGLDVAATAWAGFAAQELAVASGQQPLWDEAIAYAGYLEDLAPPEQPEARVAGWLLFDGLARELGDEYRHVAEEWQPKQPDGYCPWYSLFRLASGGKPEPDLDYLPQNGEIWLHHLLLDARGKKHEQLDEQVDALGVLADGGLYVATASGELSIRETAWMVLALTGAFR